MSTIPPRGQEPDFYTCRYFKFQPPNSVTFTSTGRFIIKSAARSHASYLKEPQLFSSQTLPPVTVEDDQLKGVAIKVTARGKVPFMLEMRINAAKQLK